MTGTDNHRLHSTFDASTQFRRLTDDNGRECGCVERADGERVTRCERHGKPNKGEGSPLGKRHGLVHSKKTGSPSARAARRMRQLAREGRDADYKKKRKGAG